MADAGWIEPGVPLTRAAVNEAARCVEPQPAFMEVFYKQLSHKRSRAKGSSRTNEAIRVSIWRRCAVRPSLRDAHGFPGHGRLCDTCSSGLRSLRGFQKQLGGLDPFHTDNARDWWHRCRCRRISGNRATCAQLGAGQMIIDRGHYLNGWR